MLYLTQRKQKKNRFAETGVSATQFCQLLIAVFQQRCFSNAETGVSATLCFDVKTIFGLRCFSNRHKNLYSLTINQLLQKHLPHIERFQQERFSSTNQFFTISENYNFSIVVRYKKKNSLLFYTIVCYKKDSQSIFSTLLCLRFIVREMVIAYPSPL